jgi:hypothetical protein
MIINVIIQIFFVLYERFHISFEINILFILYLTSNISGGKLVHRSFWKVFSETLKMVFHSFLFKSKCTESKSIYKV